MFIEYSTIGCDLSVSSSRPLVTIVTPCLNAAGTIEDNLTSVAAVSKFLASKGYGLEHWLIDGGSTDDTMAIAMENRTKVLAGLDACYTLHLESQMGSGVYEAMNRGLSKALGHYTHILNADDFIVNAMLYAEAIIKAYVSRVKIILSSIHYFRRPGPEWCHQWNVKPVPFNRSYWQHQLINGLHYPHPGFIAQTRMYQSVGFDTSYRLAADYKLMHVLLSECDTSADILVNEIPLVAMAKGGITGTLGGILNGITEINAINHELGIHASLINRYLHKLLMRFRFSTSSVDQL
jgi:glycosyltransferase involved in cell wall biosynthesis